MSGVTIDASEVREFSASLAAIPQQLQRHAKPIIEKGAVNIKDGMRSDFGASAHFKGAKKYVTYDIVDGGYGAEIGPERGAGGSIANIAYFGGAPWTERVNPGRGWQQGPGGGGTVRDPREVLLEEAPRTVRALADLARELLR